MRIGLPAPGAIPPQDQRGHQAGKPSAPLSFCPGLIFQSIKSNRLTAFGCNVSSSYGSEPTLHTGSIEIILCAVRNSFGSESISEVDYTNHS